MRRESFQPEARALPSGPCACCRTTEPNFLRTVIVARIDPVGRLAEREETICRNCDQANHGVRLLPAQKRRTAVGGPARAGDRPVTGLERPEPDSWNEDLGTVADPLVLDGDLDSIGETPEVQSHDGAA